MPGIKTAARMEAEAVCKRFPDAPNLQLARKLRDEFPLLFPSVEHARSSVRLIRGANGKQTRNQATQPRKKGKAGEKPKCPPSFAEPWTPFVLDGVKRVGIISDTHIPYHSEKSLTAAIERCKSHEIDTLFINGDYGDFYRISRWQQNPNKRRLVEEVKSMKAGLEWFRSEFPKARIVYKKGNHDERWDHFLWNRAPEFFDLPNCQLEQVLDCEKYGVEVVGDQRPIIVGKLPVMHGHELGKSGIASPVNPARGAFLRTHHTILVGHSHQTSGHADTNMWHEETFVWSTGCLCDMTPEYARINRWNWGFAIVDVSQDGSFDVQNLRINSRGEVRKS